MNRILADHGATKGPTPETSLVDLNVLNVDLPEIQEVDTIAIGMYRKKTQAKPILEPRVFFFGHVQNVLTLFFFSTLCECFARRR